MITKKSISRTFSVLLIFVILIGSSAFLPPARAAGIRYATPGGAGDCSSWAATCSLQTALTGAASGDEIWAAAGTYKPITGTDRTATFQLKSGVSLYGGFVGTETMRDQRYPAGHVTVLSGDIDNNDSQTPIITNPTTVTGNTTNSYHVVSGASGATTLDGFTITAGYADGVNPYNSGGGMYNNSNIVLMNIIFSGNIASDGGGMYNVICSPTLTNVTFANNKSISNYGGGMYNSTSNPILMNITFKNNSAGAKGGGMFNNYSSPILTNVTFWSNGATTWGGGMENLNSSNPILTNVTISGNSAAGMVGGGMSNEGGSNPQIRNTILWGNTSLTSDAQISGGASVSDSVVQNGCPAGSTCTNIITADPMLGSASGGFGSFSLQTFIPLMTGSSAIDTGNDAICPVTDQRGDSRPQAAHCDIGSYELDNTPPVVQSSTRANPNPTNLASVNFTVTFSESVVSVDTTDFTLNITSISGASFGTVTGSGTTWTVQVNTGAGNGTIRLDVNPSPGIWDMAGNQVNDGFTGGETYTIDKTTPTAAIFVDVPLSYWANSFIERLYNAGITGGCLAVPLNYCPDSTVTRAQMAVFLLKGMHSSGFTPPAVGTSTGFTDVATNYWAASWIKQLAAEGITGGCGGGNYCPDATVTRAQMAVFLLKAKHGPDYSPSTAIGVFTDVPMGYWADKWIEQLAVEGVTSGCGAGTYCPDAGVTRAQMAVFLVKTFNLP